MIDACKEVRVLVPLQTLSMLGDVNGATAGVQALRAHGSSSAWQIATDDKPS